MKFVPPRKIVPRSREATKAPVISPDPHAQAPSVSGETALFLLNLDSLDLTKKSELPTPARKSPWSLKKPLFFVQSRLTKFFLKPDKNITRVQLLVVNPRPRVVGLRSAVVRHLRTPPPPMESEKSRMREASGGFHGGGGGLAIRIWGQVIFLSGSEKNSVIKKVRTRALLDYVCPGKIRV